MAEIETIDCLPEGLPELEREWQKEGYVLSGKSSEKDLLPREYLKRSYSGNENVFGGQTKWTVIRRKS